MFLHSFFGFFSITLVQTTVNSLGLVLQSLKDTNANEKLTPRTPTKEAFITNEKKFINVLVRISNHILKTPILKTAQITSQQTIIKNNVISLANNTTFISKSLALVKLFETKISPLFSNVKFGTNFSLDDNGGGAKNQSVYLWQTNATNQNQQWEKQAVGDGVYKLIKRNATGFAINGGSVGVKGRGINLWNSASKNQNLQWYITPITTDTRSEKEKELTNNLLDIAIYPNPILSTTTIENAANAILKVYDINGKRIFTQAISNDSETINLNRMTPGIYYDEIIGESTKVVIKLVKQ